MKCYILSNFRYTPLLINVLGYACPGDLKIRGVIPSQFYSAQFIISGCGYFGKQRLTKGQGFLIYPGQIIEYYADSNDPWEYVWVLSSDDSIKEIFKEWNTDECNLVFNFENVNRVKTIAEAIAVKSQNTHRVEALEMLEMFLYMTNHQSLISTDLYLDNKQRNSDLYLSFCEKYIKDNIEKKITVKQLADAVGVSQPYLNRLFVQKYRVSPKQYILDKKLRQAKKLLLSTEISIKSIAEMVGYSDALAFSRYFAAKEKISPHKYRERMTKD